MFLKIRTLKNKKYISIVQSYRKDGKIKHKELLNLGAVDNLVKSRQLEALTKKLIEIHNWDIITKKDISEVEGKLCYGVNVYKNLWREFEYDKLMKQFEKQRRIKFNLNEIILFQVLGRLLSPSSRLSLWQKQNRYIFDKEISLHDIYRSLDVISENKDSIEWHTFNKYRNLFNLKVDVVFYDCTTFHFESVRVDDLREFGYSKSGNFNEIQVIMGLLIDKEGHPVGFNLFPGNLSENDTFIHALDKLKNRFMIDRIIFVADKALNSKKNIYLLQENGYKYIVSSRIKNVSKEIKNKIFDSNGYNVIKNKNNEEQEEEIYKYKVIEQVEHSFKERNKEIKKFKNRLIITWSQKRDKYDKMERERMVEKAINKYQNKGQIQFKRGWKKYLKLDSKLTPVGIDMEKIKEDSKWDGYYGIETNIFSDELQESTIIDNLHNLWKIEETFRVYKTTIEAEPVFVWNINRIKGHFVICFLALVLERALETKLRLNKIYASPQRIRESLNGMELYKLSIKGKKFFLKAKVDTLGESILKILKIKQPQTLIAEEDIKYFL